MKPFRILAAGLLFSLTGILVSAQYHYTLSWDNPQSHLYQISLETDPSPGGYTDFQMPEWRPGRYLVQNFASGVSAFGAKTGQENLSWKKVDKDTWRVTNPASGKIRIQYAWYANELDAGSSTLNLLQAYFNPSNLFMHVRDRYDVACTLTVSSMPANWKSGTALHKTAQHNVFTAADYHEFVDSPTILSPSLKTLSRTVDGVTYYFHFQGKYAGGVETDSTLLRDVPKIIRAQAAIFGGKMPLTEYHFIFQLLPWNMRHAVEHSYSSCYAMPERVASSPDAIKGLYGIISHEFFHLWNVKRVRPASLWPYNYQQVPYTTLHWFTEGVTDYYTSVALARAGLMTRESFYANFATTISDMENSYAGRTVSPEAASFNSWLVRSDYQDPNQNVSYYPLGERVGLILDLHIRNITEGKKSLDDVMRYLYDEYYVKNKGVPEDGVEKAVAAVTGKDVSAFFKNYIAGTAVIPYDELLAFAGLELERTKNEISGWRKLGIMSAEKTPAGYYVNQTWPGSPAETAGIGAGDILLSLNGTSLATADADKALDELGKKDKVTVTVLTAMSAENKFEFKLNDDYWPETFVLREMKKLKPEAEAQLNSWIGVR